VTLSVARYGRYAPYACYDKHRQAAEKMLSEHNEKRCVGCGVAAPQAETNYTLVSSRYGWRLTIVNDAAGRKSSELRCPTCWARHRLSRATLPGVGSQRKP
jgi:hypothetical protein